MRVLTLTAAFFFAINLNAQTNVIANKSHSGDLSNLEQEPDDFGGPFIPMKLNVDSVIYYKKTCFIEVRKVHITRDSVKYSRDTICSTQTIFSLPTNKVEFDSFKSLYLSSTKFIGFEEINKKKGTNNGTTKKSAIPLFFSCIILLVAFYSFLPLLRKKA